MGRQFLYTQILMLPSGVTQRMIVTRMAGLVHTRIQPTTTTPYHPPTGCHFRHRPKHPDLTGQVRTTSRSLLQTAYPKKPKAQRMTCFPATPLSLPTMTGLTSQSNPKRKAVKPDRGVAHEIEHPCKPLRPLSGLVAPDADSERF